MDDTKVIDMMHKFFGEKYGKTEYSPQERIEQYTSLRKILEKVFDWYDEHSCKKTGEAPVTRHPVYQELPAFDIPEAMEIKAEIMPILIDFNKRGVTGYQVREHIEGFMDRVKNGWGSSLRKAKEFMS